MTTVSLGGAGEGAGARIAAIAHEREGALLHLLEGRVRARVLPSSLADAVAEVTLRWGAPSSAVSVGGALPQPALQ